MRSKALCSLASNQILSAIGLRYFTPELSVHAFVWIPECVLQIYLVYQLLFTSVALWAGRVTIAKQRIENTFVTETFAFLKE